MPRLLAAMLTIVSLLLSACTTLHKGDEFSELATTRKTQLWFISTVPGLCPSGAVQH